MLEFRGRRLWWRVRSASRSWCPRWVVTFQVVFALLVGTAARAEDWPQFRGPNSSGVAVGAGRLPVEFSATENVRWSASVGDGVGCPVVAAGRVFVSGMLEEETLALMAFDAASGKRLWRRTWDVSGVAETHKTNSHASTTPAADDRRVYFYSSRLGMLALDAATGEDVWRAKLPEPFFVFKWGPAMSPVLYNDLVLFCQDDDLHPAIYAFDKSTGAVLWKDDRRDMAVNYSHPVVCRTPRGDEIVVAGTGMLIGYDPATGKRLWYAKVLLRNIKTTPVSVDGVVYVSLQSAGIANQWLATADRGDTGNNDGKLTKAEMQAFVGKAQIPEAFYRRTFDRGDMNKDGVLEGRELDLAFLHPDNFAGARFDVADSADEYVLAVRGGGRGDVTKTHLLWKHKTRHTDHVVSPLVAGGRMLLVKSGGIMTVFDTADGTPRGKPRRIPNASNYFASPVLGDGKIYIAAENGKVIVLADAPDYKLLAENDVGDDIIGTPAISRGRLYLRTRAKLVCLGLE